MPRLRRIVSQLRGFASSFWSTKSLLLRSGGAAAISGALARRVGHAGWYVCSNRFSLQSIKRHLLQALLQHLSCRAPLVLVADQRRQQCTDIGSLLSAASFIIVSLPTGNLEYGWVIAYLRGRVCERTTDRTSRQKQKGKEFPKRVGKTSSSPKEFSARAILAVCQKDSIYRGGVLRHPAKASAESD